MPIDPRYDRAPIFRGGGGGGNRIADLIYQSGRDQAQSYLRSGDATAEAIRGITGGLTTALGQYGEAKDQSDVAKAIEAAQPKTGAAAPDVDAILAGLPSELRGKAMSGIQDFQARTAKAQEAKLQIQKLQQEIATQQKTAKQHDLDAVAVGAFRTRDFLSSPDGGLTGITVLSSMAKKAGIEGSDQYDDFIGQATQAMEQARQSGDPTKVQATAEAIRNQAGPILEKMMLVASPETAKLFKPETEKVEITNPDGSKTIKLVEKKAGQTFESSATPPKPGTEEAFIVGRYGRNPTPEQALKGRAEYAAAGREHKATEGDESRKRLVAAVVANPALWDDLTPSDKGNIAGDLNKQGFTGFGKGLPEKAIGKISESKSAVDSLRDLRDVLEANEQYIGPIAGLQAMNPYSDARKAQANIDLVRQRVGKALEGGVLRKEDEVKYQKILATLRDEPETAIYKVDNIIKNIENDMANYIEEQRLSGRRVNTGVENRAGSGKAPAKGARRMVQGKLAEWDGQGWTAVR